MKVILETVLKQFIDYIVEIRPPRDQINTEEPSHSLPIMWKAALYIQYNVQQVAIAMQLDK